MATKPQSQKQSKAGGSSTGQAVAWVIAPVLGVVALPTLILLAVGMLPTVVSYFIVDRHPSKYTTRTIGYLNFAGCLPYALDIWQSGGVFDFEVVFEILTDPLSLLVMYTAAATGWIVFASAPPVVAAYLTVTSEIKTKTFEARQQELVEDWGRNVRHGAMGEELKDDDDAPDQPAEPVEPVDAS